MTVSFWFALTAIALFLIGLHGLIARRHVIRKFLAMNVMGSGVFLLLVAGAYRTPAGPPDPVPHAMVLTGIVVAVSSTALALALARLAARPSDSPPDDDR